MLTRPAPAETIATLVGGATGRGLRARRLVVACCGLLALAIPSASARPQALPQTTGVVDLTSQANLRIHGLVNGWSIALGDVNGDGLADAVIGDIAAASAYGSVFVVYGRSTPGDVDVNSLGSAGFRVDGPFQNSDFGVHVAVVGDMNGDGRSEIAVAQTYANGGLDTGSVYVIYGEPSSGGFPISQIGAYGFRIDGRAGDRIDHVTGVGDVNGDGKADLLISSPIAKRNGQSTSAGIAYVVFGRGRDAPGPVDLTSIGNSGFEIDPGANDSFLGSSLAGGDVNGDGLADLVIGADSSGNNGAESGSVYVVYGKKTTSSVDLGALGSGGFRLDGVAPGDGLGDSVAVVGDMNGDGLPEIAAVAGQASDGGRPHAGAVYVIYGATSSGGFPLTQIGAYGFRIDGPSGTPNGLQYARVGPAGDVNGDGRGDVVIGVLDLGNGKSAAGTTYVVFGRGRNDTAPVDLADPARVGLRIDGAAPNDNSGIGVDAAGDVNGDHRADIAVASLRTAYVVYGFGQPKVAYSAHSFTFPLGKTIAPIAPATVARTGDAAFSVSPPLPTGLTLDPKTGVVSGTPTTVQPATKHTVTLTDLVGTASDALTIEVKAPTTTTTTDTTPPTLTLAGPLSQRLLKQRGITVTMSCDEPCTLIATGSVAISGVRTVLGLTRAATTLTTAGSVKLTLAFSPAAQKRLKKLWKRGRRAVATITVKAVDRSGNATTSKRIVAVKR